jgi:hypothetical protein
MPRSINQKIRDTTTELARVGLNDVQIASRLGMSVKHLRRQLADEIMTGRSEGDTQLAQTAMQLALSGMAPAFTKYMCQVRLGWYEVSGLIVKDGGTIEVDGERVASVIDERLARLRTAAESKVKTIEAEVVS